jgi:hypothetical protein
MRVKADRCKVGWIHPKCHRNMSGFQAQRQLLQVLLVAALCTSRFADAIKYEGEIVLPDTGETDHVFPGSWSLFPFH